MRSLSGTLAEWAINLAFEDIPDQLIQASKVRLLDTIGLVIGASSTEFGRAVRQGASQLGGVGDSRILGTRDRSSLGAAALANGALAHSLLFDDTHNETYIHVSSPVVAAGLACGDRGSANGRDILTAFAVGSEISCRVGLIAPGAVHTAGFHGTSVYGVFGAAVTASRLCGLDANQTRDALGIVGSMASGINQSWADGAMAQSLHPGLAANSGIAAALLAQQGITGPADVLEGRFGLLRSHVQAPGYAFDFDRAIRDLGETWESLQISLKPYPCAHFIHPFLDAMLKLRVDGLRVHDVKSVTCPIADYMAPIVCEPATEKQAPTAAWQGRTSLQFSLAEALVTGRLDAQSYSPESLANPAIRDLASRVECVIDKDAPPRGQFKGHVTVVTTDGRRLEHVEMFNRGSPQHPMTEADLVAKFLNNAAVSIPKRRCEDIVKAVYDIDQMPSCSTLVELCCV